ncbi:hypothetical protein C8Q74DRAFT_1412330 [Fomes fomentarius]|nr:hypothetical protein C8Q74DRAFT_1412330 [Fomes fomentarius]
MASPPPKSFNPHLFFDPEDNNNFDGIAIDTDHVLRSTIFILTTLIAGYRVSETRSSPKKDEELKLWSNLSAILSLRPGHFVAVTGQVIVKEEELLIKSALVATNHGKERHLQSGAVTGNAGQQGGASIVDLELHDDDQPVSRLFLYPESKSSIKDHAQDVYTILSHFIRVPEPEKRPGMYVNSLTDFTIYRTRRLLSSRLRCGNNFWGDNPIRLIEAAWKSSRKDGVPLSDPPDNWLKDTSIRVRNKYVVRLLKNAGIAPSESTSTDTVFPMTVSNGKQWARVLLDALECLEKHLQSINKPSSEERESRRLELVDNLQISRGALRVIDEFIRSHVVAKLVTPKLALELREKYNLRVKDPNFQPEGAVPTDEEGAGKLSVHPTVGDAEEFRADLDFRDDGDGEGDPNAAHVIRYISTLALPISASRALMQSIAKYRDANVQLSMSFLNATDSQTIDVAVVQELKTALMKSVRPSETASVEKLFQAYWSLANEDKKFKVSIHAEAALMGAVFSHITGTPNASTIRIGVSKKCCFCCRLLGEELNDWRKLKLKGSDCDSTYPEFILPGSHSTVFPWLPPRGVPLKVLKNIRVELLKCLWELIQEGMYAKSAQTSPARSERSLPDDDNEEEMDLKAVWNQYGAV